MLNIFLSGSLIFPDYVFRRVSILDHNASVRDTVGSWHRTRDYRHRHSRLSNLHLLEEQTQVDD